MRPQRVVKIDVRRDQEVEVPLAEDNKVSQAFIFDTSNPTLDVDVLIRSMGSNGNHSGAAVLQDGIEFGDELPIPIPGDMIRPQPGRASSIEKDFRLPLHPLSIGLKTAGRAVHSPGGHVDERQYKALPQAFGRPNALAEEIDLPERLGVDLQELIPSAFPTSRPRQHPGLFEDVFDRALRDRMDSQLLSSPKIRP